MRADNVQEGEATDNPVLVLVMEYYGLNAQERVADIPVLVLMMEYYSLNVQERVADNPVCWL